MSAAMNRGAVAPSGPPVSEELLDELIGRLDLAQKVRLLTGADFWALHEEPAIGLRRLVTSDGPAGVRGETWDERDTSANVPSPTSLAATWDLERVERVGRLLAWESRRKGVDVLLAPTVNLHRSPYGGRHFEAFSEDPELTAQVGAAYVRGVQSGGVGATVKHFVANDSETDRFVVDAIVDERTLRELYLVPFEVIVQEAGVWAVMAAYNSVNGHTMTESPLLRRILHEEWGFDGVIVSDWYAARTLAAAPAGLDLVMPGPKGPFGDLLVSAVADGQIEESVVDDKVRRVLRLAGRVGALASGPAATAPQSFSTEQVAAELRAAAAAGFVLLRNAPPERGAEPVLPLRAEAFSRLAILGPGAAVARTLGGGSALVFPPHTVSPLEGLRAAVPAGVVVDTAPGVRAHTRVPMAPVELLRRPDGGRGVEVRFLDEQGAVLGSEVRESGGFNWLSRFLPGVPIAAVRTVEVRTTLVAAEAGRYRVGCSGLGVFRLTGPGRVLVDERLALAPGDDPVLGLMAPPQASADLDLEAGEEVDLLLAYRLESPTFGDGAVQFDSASFQLNIEAPYEDDDAAIERAVRLAAAADVAVVVVGTTEEVESEGFDRTSLALPGRQDDLVEAVAAANPRTIVVVNSGAPVLLPWADRVAAVLVSWFPGQEFGAALADVLLGAVEPGGRLPVSWPMSEKGALSTTPVDGRLAYDERLAIGYRREDVVPHYAFGAGLGYTTWEYRGISAPDSVGAEESVTVQVTVGNTGARSGRHVVQLYSQRPAGRLARPARSLVAFAAVDAAPGEEVTASLAVPARAWRHWDEATSAWAVEPGTVVLHAGGSSDELPVSAQVTVSQG